MEFSLTDLSSPTQGVEERHVKVLILGSGPAGLSAALYAARADLEPVVLTGMELGGQVSLTFTIENYPGFPEGVGGSELVELFQKQAERFGAKVEFDTATEVDLSGRPFRVKTYNTTYLADTLIITTGATPRHLDVPGEKELTGRGVSYCATCDGWFFKDKGVVVVGGGDSALEEGIFLTRYANSVTIIHRRDELRAGPVLEKRARENPKIELVQLDTTYYNYVPVFQTGLNWPIGTQNVKINGIFGYTDPDGTSWGKTPDAIAEACKMLVIRNHAKLADPARDEWLRRSFITSERTRDQAISLADPSTRGLATRFTGDPEIDQILAAYSRPPAMGAV